LKLLNWVLNKNVMLFTLYNSFKNYVFNCFLKMFVCQISNNCNVLSSYESTWLIRLIKRQLPWLTLPILSHSSKGAYHT